MRIMLFFCVAVLALWRIVPDYKNHPLFIDEHEFIRKTYYFDLLFLKHSLGDKRWYDGKEDDVAQPKLGPYIYGFSLHIAGIRDIESALAKTRFNTIKINGNVWWSELWLKNPDTFPKELAESMKLIFIGRRVAMGFTVGSVLLLYILCALVGSVECAYVVSLLVLINPLWNWEGRFAMTDTMQIFFFILGLIILVFWHRAWQKKETRMMFLQSAALGVVCALATGVKVTGIMLVFFILLYHVILFVFDASERSRIHELLWSAFIVVTVFCGLFYAMNPFLYAHPITNFIYMFQHRLEAARTYYVKLYPGSALKTRSQALWFILVRTLLPGAWYGNFSMTTLPADLLLFLGGITMLLRRSVLMFRSSKRLQPFAILPLWIGFVFFCLSLYLTNDWSRYYLPFVYSICIAEGYMMYVVMISVINAMISVFQKPVPPREER